MTAGNRANRARIARRQAQQLGLRMVERTNTFTLHSPADGAVFTGSLSALERYLEEVYVAAPCGPDRARVPAAWREPIKAYCGYLTGIGRAPGTIRHHRLTIGRMGRELRCAPVELTADRIIEWFSRQRWKPETRRSVRSTILVFCEWAFRAGRTSARIVAADLPSVRVPGAVARPVPDAVLTASMAAADARTALMLRISAEAGLRRGEVCKVHVADVIDGAGGPQLFVRGKGGRERMVPISDDLAATLRMGAAAHTPELAAVGAGYLFPGRDRDHLEAHYVGKLMSAALPPGWSAHKARHRYATAAYRGSRNLPAVQQLLGHSSIATTQRYVGVRDDEIRAAAMAATLNPDGQL